MTANRETLSAPNAANKTCSKSVQLDGGPWDPLFSEEVGDLDPLIALELDDLAHLLVVDEGSVAGKFLLECLEELLGIVLLGQTLQGGQSLPSISLLNTNVDVILLSANVVVAEVALVSERVERV